MSSAVPAIILLAQERAGSFRRCLEILCDSWTNPPSHQGLQESLLFLDELALNRGSRVTLDTPLVTLEWVLAWATSSPPPPVSVLREARAALEKAAADWADSFLLLQEMSKRAQFWTRTARAGRIGSLKSLEESPPRKGEST